MKLKFILASLILGIMSTTSAHPYYFAFVYNPTEIPHAKLAVTAVTHGTAGSIFCSPMGATLKQCNLTIENPAETDKQANATVTLSMEDAASCVFHLQAGPWTKKLASISATCPHGFKTAFNNRKNNAVVIITKTQ